MYLVHTTDEHITVNPPVCRKDDFLNTLIRKLTWLASIIKKYNALHTTSGDITDKDVYKSTNWLLDTMNFVQQHMPKTTGVLGNHDLRHRSLKYLDKSMASVFISSGLFDLITEPREIEKDVWLHGYSFGEEITHPDMSLYSEESKHIMLYHGYVFNTKTSMVNGFNASALMKEYPEFDLFLTGDHHEKFVVEQDGQILINGGPLYRGSINKIDYKPAVWLINTDDFSYEEILVPIEDGVISTTHKDEVVEKENRMESVVDVVMENEGVTISYTDNVEALIESNSEVINENVEVFIRRSLEENE